MATMMNDTPGSLAFADAQSFARVGKKSVGSGGFQGGSKTHTLMQKVRQKHVPLGRKSFRTAPTPPVAKGLLPPDPLGATKREPWPRGLSGKILHMNIAGDLW